MRQIALDTETTGLEVAKGHRLIELGCVEIIDRRITGNTFHHYVNPKRDVDEESQNIHGLSSKFLQDKPLFTDIVADFIDFIDAADLIIHNATFDVGFLEMELGLAKVDPWHIKDYCKIIDTLKMARKLHPGRRNNLDVLCKRYKIDSEHRTLHGALIDANLLARVYLAMTSGQGSLFDNDMGFAEVKPTDLLSQYQPSKIILANQLELRAHEKMMTMIKRGRNNES